LKADINSQVEIEFSYIDGEHQRLTFVLVPDEQADFYDGFLGLNTPLAKAILGHEVGSTIEYRAGDVNEVQILSVKPTTQQVSTDRAAQREQVIRRAVAESELKNRIAIATSVDNKWGDYDQAGLLDSLEGVTEEPDK
jgi:hypothetical protein